ncbi:hypothetical protein JCM6882_007398 [Rhodosporidiobolus microsporus]
MAAEGDTSTPSMLSRLPGDAHPSPSPSPSPSPAPSPAPEPSTSSAALQPNPGPDGEARTTILTSVSPSDPTKRRDFEARYYLPSSSTSGHAYASRSFLDLPESYFSPTATELQQAFAGQVKRREELTDRPLLTKRLREREEAEKSRQKAARWPQTRIRIRFADRSQLEGVFPSTDKLVHLYEFVRLALREDMEGRDGGWYLYQSPPRTEYRKSDPKWRGKSLMDLEFTPSSVLYIKFDEEALNGAFRAVAAPSVLTGFLAFIGIADEDATTPPPLLPSLLSAAAPLPLPPSFTSDTPDSGPAPKSADDLKKDKEAKLRKLLGGGNKGSVKPGWLKVGKDAHKK